jgi:hypothetical protein
VWEEKNLIQGAYYRLKVSAFNYVGEGANSTEAIVLCAETPAAPG